MHKKSSSQQIEKSIRKHLASGSGDQLPNVYLPLCGTEEKDNIELKDYGAIVPLSPHQDNVDTDEDPYDNFSDSEAHFAKSTDDFGDIYNIAYSSARTGRHRRKLAARTKGGEFQASRRKRRLYFCCLGSEIDIQAVHDHLQTSDGWSLKLYGDVLRLFRPGLGRPLPGMCYPK